MKISLTTRPRYAAFTLIEMIGVLAVIAILASLLIPKILNAINDSKINNAVLSYNTVKTATMEHYGKYGKFAGPGGSTLVSGTAFDSVLLKDGLVDKPFASRIAGDNSATVTNAFVLALAPSDNATTVTLAGGGYNLAGAATATNDAFGSQFVIEVVMKGVAEADAKAFNDRLDGASLGVPLGTANDFAGRVKYTVASGVAEVHAYIAHR